MRLGISVIRYGLIQMVADQLCNLASFTVLRAAGICAAFQAAASRLFWAWQAMSIKDTDFTFVLGHG